MGAALAAIPPAFEAVFAASATASQVAIVASTVAAATTAAASAYQGYTSYKQSQFQSAVAKNNAIISKNNANLALEQGQTEESAKRTETGRKIGMALAEQGAGGVDVSFGSPGQVRKGLLDEGDLDALTIRYNAMAKAAGFKGESEGYKASSKFAESAGNQALVAAGINVGADFASGASSISNQQWLASTGQAGRLPGNTSGSSAPH